MKVTFNNSSVVVDVPYGAGVPLRHTQSMSGSEWWDDGDGWERRRKVRLTAAKDLDGFYVTRPLRQAIATGRKTG